MSKHKAGGKTGQHVSPEGKRLGLKVAHGEKVNPGQILVRQNGTNVKAGEGVKVGRDFTLYAKKRGSVRFAKKIGRKLVTVD